MKEEDINLTSKQIINIIYYSLGLGIGFFILLNGEIIYSAIWYILFFLIEIIYRIHKTKDNNRCVLD